MLPSLLVLPALCLTGSLTAGEFAPIPAEIWAIKEDAAKGMKGALILEDRITFHNTYVEYRYRVRIFGESGRRAAELSSFPEAAYNIEGRTVYADGKVVPFNKRKDFASKAISSGDSDSKRTVLVPPGVTSDCVMEITWRESAAGEWTPLPARLGMSHSFDLANAFPTLESVVAVPSGSFPFAHLPLGTRTLKPEMTEKGGFRIFTFRNIPAKEEVSYTLDATREFPRFVVYDVPAILRNAAREGAVPFWKYASTIYYKNYFMGDVSKGRAYNILKGELWEGISGSPQEQAQRLMVKLDGRIRNLSQSTFAEVGTLTKKQAEEEVDSRDLEKAARRGSTDGLGMVILYFNLLLDRGIPAKLAFVSDRDERLFNFNLPDVRQFRNEIVVVEEPGKPALWVQPSLRFAQPGLIHPDYQGTPCLMIDPKDWSATRLQVPAQPGGFNVRRYVVDVFPEEGADRFAIRASFTGFPEYSERQKYMALEPKEQVKALKERQEANLRSAAFTRVEVKGAQDARALVTWEAEGTIEVDEARQREVRPFPSIPYALFIPDEFPAGRKDPILIPYLRIQDSSSTIHVPEGWKWGGSDAYEQANRFGSVKWTAAAMEGGLVKVNLNVEVRGFFEGAAAYDEFKTFLGWVKEASSRTLLLQKSR